MIYLNHYRCSKCGHKWQGAWDCTCDDDCPNCGDRHYSPVTSDVVGPGYVDHAGNLIHVEDGYETTIAQYADDQEPGPDVHRLTLESFEDAARLTLGDPHDKDAPNLYVERHEDHWLVFVHPHAGAAAFTVQIFDDKRVEVQHQVTAEILVHQAVDEDYKTYKRHAAEAD